MRLAEKTQMPVAVAPTAKAVIDETFPHYLGLYNGKASEPQRTRGDRGQRLPAVHRLPADRPDHGRLHRRRCPPTRSTSAGTRWTSAMTTTRR